MASRSARSSWSPIDRQNSISRSTRMQRHDRLKQIPGLVRLLVSASALYLGGCLYHFTGGGLPAGIRTVAIVTFDNLTPEPTLTQEITRAVREAVESRLGLR